MKINGSETKGLAELNQHVQDEQKETKDGVVGEGQGISDEDESRIIEDNEDAKAGCLTLVHARVLLQNQQQQQQQSQGPVIRWERFLPVRSLKVLLVENDDSTRQVVSALLRNCSYEAPYHELRKRDFYSYH
ncbi:hypothetical protein RJ641_005457 [Dillenia turbinata]|uniref:Response regulatory domain-containing protein n=1 Tax=Dillenia turbinata TaxID=194707 RepID=A0AAN8Z919_9MAGN